MGAREGRALTMVKGSLIRQPAVVGAAAAALAALLGACGGGTTTSTKSESPTPSVTGPAVQIADFKFTPQTLTVKAGETVTWSNTSATPHNVVADDSSFKSDNLNKDQTFTHTFAAAGTFKYTCTIHPQMTGTVTVTA
jgi:amicyanin